ncbi:hypothetical protein ACFLIM_15880 [Nonomuraea sp. M3C6]|uniref:Uncharacterized protein n=1 Tax=Nonomuraea marmarensis TaxID=3351344 RepID=A0ABW7ABC5_9ACTN
MPRRQDGPPPGAPEPFETTGAFALPNDPATGFPPANDPAGAFPPPSPTGDEAGPFETTGAFARPPDWDQPADRPGPFNPADRPSAFDPPGRFDGSASFARPAPFNGGANGPDDQTAAFGGPGPFDGPTDRPGPFDGPTDRPGPFDGPADRPGPFDGPGDRTGRFDAPSGPIFGGPPEPGDIKVAGEPTAVQAPAWADAETGFLGSGWSSDGMDEPDEPRSRRGRRRPARGDDVLTAPSGGGKGKVALLSVAAVAVVLGGTVAGVKFMSSAADPGPRGTAVQATTNQSGPEVSDPAVEETEPEEAPSDGAPEETTPEETPTPTPTYSARTPRRTATPTPTKTTKTKMKTSATPTEEPADPPVEVSVTDSPTQDASTLDDVAPNIGTTPVPTDTPTVDSAPTGGSVNVKQTINQRLTTYKADMRLSNTSQETLEKPTVSVPVEGRVMNVAGAEWTQDGDLLILDLPESLPAGDSVDVSFTATGRGQRAENCGLVTGECAVT